MRSLLYSLHSLYSVDSVHLLYLLRLCRQDEIRAIVGEELAKSAPDTEREEKREEEMRRQAAMQRLT